VYTYEHILESAGILMEDTGATGKKKKTATVTTQEERSSAKDDLRSMSLEDLHKLLNDVLEHEDYIRAIAIRDEINKRSKGK
jgi:protein-arginine kinase activator protein McsA